MSHFLHLLVVAFALIRRPRPFHDFRKLQENSIGSSGSLVFEQVKVVSHVIYVYEVFRLLPSSLLGPSLLFCTHLLFTLNLHFPVIVISPQGAQLNSEVLLEVILPIVLYLDDRLQLGHEMFHPNTTLKFIL